MAVRSCILCKLTVISDNNLSWKPYKFAAKRTCTCSVRYIWYICKLIGLTSQYATIVFLKVTLLNKYNKSSQENQLYNQISDNQCQWNKQIINGIMTGRTFEPMVYTPLKRTLSLILGYWWRYFLGAFFILIQACMLPFWKGKGTKALSPR